MGALDYFIPDRDPPAFYPLSNFLQSPPVSVAERYVAAFTEPGDLIIDPFACKPTLARVAHKMGRRAILFDNNPFWAWLARAMATVPSAGEINAAFARLGDAVKDDVPLRAHIAQLYATRCVECNQLTPVDYFIHLRDEGPLQRHYTCVNCGATRDDPATPDDLERARAFDSKGFHYHLAFERVIPAENLHADRIRKMLDLYTPRNLYALVTITVKSDTLFRTPRERQILALLLVHLLDRGTSFYAEPDKPAQLTRHKRFVEFNLWREIEYAARNLAKLDPSLTLRASSSQGLKLSESARAVTESVETRAWIGRASAKKIAEEIPAESARLILAAPPPRRPAIWALSYFWGAWTLKRTAVRSLVPFLDPQTIDPTWERRWYFDSVTSSLTALAKILGRDARAVLVFDDSAYETMETVLLGASGAGMELESFAFQPHLGDYPRREFDSLRASYRITFSPSQLAGDGTREKIDPSDLKTALQATALDAGREILTRRGEPLGFPWLHHAAYTRAARNGLLAQVMRAELKSPPGRFVFQAVQDGLVEGYAHDFDHHAGQEQFLWFRRAPTEPPLIDRVQQAVQDVLSRGEISCADLDNEIYQRFPNDLTPEAGLIGLCANAYADEREGKWIARQEDVAAEKTHAQELIAKLGQQLEYAIAQNENPFDWVWKEQGGAAHGFVWRDTAAFVDLARIHIAPTRGYLLVPESQIALLTEKTRRLSHLVEAFRDAGWDFVRLASVEKLLDGEKIERNDLVLMTGLVPMVMEERAQLELF